MTATTLEIPLKCFIPMSSTTIFNNKFYQLSLKISKSEEMLGNRSDLCCSKVLSFLGLIPENLKACILSYLHLLSNSPRVLFMIISNNMLKKSKSNPVDFLNCGTCYSSGLPQSSFCCSASFDNT